MSREFTILVLSSLFSSAFTFEHAQLVSRSLPQQAPYEGGWALGIPGATCPSDASVTCSATSLTNNACCPAGQFCFGVSSYYCCPTKADCETTVTNFPACANDTWLMYMIKPSQQQYICCPPGQIGILPLSNWGGLCQYSEVQVDATRIATRVDEPKTGTASRTTTSTARTSSTATITSTRSDGALVTATKAVTSKNTSTGAAGTTGAPASQGTDDSSMQSSSSSSKSLSAGAIAGIAIGIAGVLALLLVAFLLYRRKSNNKDTTQGSGAQAHNTYAGAPLHGSAPTYSPVPQNSDNYPIPVGEKTPAMAAASVNNGGFVRTQEQPMGNELPNSFFQGPHHGGYGGAVEAPATQQWESRAELGPGR